MPNSDHCLDSCVTGGFGHRRAVLEEWGGQTIFEAEKLDMVQPSGGVAAAHLVYVLYHAVLCRAGVAPDVVVASTTFVFLTKFENDKAEWSLKQCICGIGCPTL